MEYKVSTRKKDGNWQCTVSYKQGGKWRSKSKQGFKTEKEAKKYSWTLLKLVEETLLLDTPEKFENITIEKFIDIFIDDNKNTWSPNTHIANEMALMKLKPIYNKKVVDIKSYDLIGIINDMKAKYANSTMKLRFGIYKRLFQHAIKPYRIISENPLDDIPLNLKSAKTNKDVLSIEEIEEVIISMRNSAPLHFHVMIAIAGYAGLRYGEVLGLTWNDFDEVNHTLNINKQWGVIDINGKNGFRDTKTTNSNRVIPIPNKLIDILDDYKKSLNLDILPNRLFYKLTSVCTNNVNNRIRAAGYNFTFHNLRHSYATTLVANGVDILTVASLVGDDVNTVMKTYIHYSDQMRIEAKSKIKEVYL